MGRAPAPPALTPGFARGRAGGIHPNLSTLRTKFGKSPLFPDPRLTLSRIDAYNWPHGDTAPAADRQATRRPRTCARAAYVPEPPHDRGETMHPTAHPSPLLSWSASRARVAVSLASDRAAGGGRRWHLRLSAEAQRLDLPLNVHTPVGLEPLLETQSAVLSAAGRILQELGAVPTDAVGAPLLASLHDAPRAEPAERVG